MATFTVIQAGNQLQMVSESGVVGAPLLLPFGVTLRTDIPPRFLVYGRYVILTNTPTVPLTISPTGVVRVLTPAPPKLGAILTGAPNTSAVITSNSIANPTIILTAAPTAIINGQQITITGDTTSTPPINGTWFATVIDSTHFSIPVAVSIAGSGATVNFVTGGGGLTGTYNVRYTFVINDETGALISESDYSPLSNIVTIASQFLNVAGLDISPDDISLRRIYRSATGGAVLFEWVDLDGNILTSIQDDLADAGLSLVASPILGSVPDLTLIAEFRDRLWGVDRVHIDDLRHTEIGLMYAWPPDNTFPVPPIGSDNLGIRALIPRRESLGVARQNQLLAMTGSDDNNFALSRLSQDLGVSSQESVAVFRDVAYFLWEDGVYEWSDAGLVCVSDKKAAVGSAGVQGYSSVRSWFDTDSYFDRTQFSRAFAAVDPIRFKYRLFLVPIGQPTSITWVEYDLNSKTWWGPHVTSAFTPTSVFTVLDSNLVPRQTIGGADSNLYREQTLRTDGINSPIITSVLTKHYSMEEPDLDKYWGELSVIGAAQITGTVFINLNVGALEAVTTSVEVWDLTQSRQRLRRVGDGKHVQFEFTNNQVAQNVEIYAFEVDPVHILGRR